MAKIQKKGNSGAAKNYITRTRAVKKLQISLPDFRRLCIFKGIYPREPRKKKKVSKGSTAATTFYYTKDIQYLLHEPLLAKFREHKAVAKKIAKALGRGEAGDAARLEKNLAPKIKLDHIIKERYPTFTDALRDLDDALSMLFLFANLPSSQHVPAKTIALCQKLCHEFEHYVITSHSLRRSFLSIKGIYYQATIQGQDVLWLVPYRFVQRTGGDIDFRIMGTFVEFYTTLLGFVNYRLYTSIGLVYPPKFNADLDAQGAELSAFQIEGKSVATNGDASHGDVSATANPEAQAVADRIAAAPIAEEEQPDTAQAVQAVEDENTETIDKFEAVAPDADVLPQPSASSAEVASLFAPYTIYLSRETPRAPLEFILKAFGCKRVGWDSTLGDGAFTSNESDASITHQIVDRTSISSEEAPEIVDGAAPKVQWPRSTMPGRTYVQPQWVWDCINQGKLLRPDLYAPGAELPPHLSPWVKAKKGEYDPNLPLQAQELEGEAEAFEDEEEVASEAEEASEDADDADDAMESDASVEAGEGMQVDGSDDEEDVDDDEPQVAADDFEGFDSDAESDVSEGEAARLQHQRELEAEATGKKLEPEVETTKSKNAAVRKKAEKKRKEEQEERDRQKMMLSNKKRKLLKRIEYGSNKRDAEAESLRRKKRRLDKAKAASEAV
ncbi:mRNA-binding ribosome synthesis protein nop7 [Didymosphaeria variabile]|uniref:Pescadillo homolog n=1 Tax=Didymosphaeria variabile TaxID=1932322 RepID=A0A9W8XSU7_9PLEO|nr:mRNA-binding ribosome synthesis protein nop7 [Didymosphaeria variabile]KAJ4358480.1 mRNA-binding ribosome synthesis protein nop7 [Didymosphaeria variabile]